MAIPMVLATVIYRAIDEYLEIGLAWSILAAILLWGLFNVIAIKVYPFLSQIPLFAQVQNS